MALRDALFPAGRLAGVGRHGGRRDLLSVSRGGCRTGGCDRDLLHRRRHLSRVCRRALRRHDGSSARSSCSTGCSSSRILGGFLVLAVWFVPGRTWIAAGAGLDRLRPRRAARSSSSRRAPTSSCSARWSRIPDAAASINLTLVQLGARQGLRHGRSAPATFRRRSAAKKVNLAHTGFMFAPITRGDGAWHGLVAHRPRGSVGRVLRRRHSRHVPAGAALRHVPPRGQLTSRASGSARRWRRALARQAGAWLGGAIAFLGAWILFKTQLDNLEGMVRAHHRHPVDRQPPGAPLARRRRARGVLQRCWPSSSCGASSPCVSRSRSSCCKLGANVAGLVFIVASVHLLYINTRLLPEHVRPPLWRRAALVAMALFYGFFVTVSIRSVWGS